MEHILLLPFYMISIFAVLFALDELLGWIANIRKGKK